MAYCGKCGKEFAGDTAVCPACGAAQAKSPSVQTSDSSARDAQDNKVMGILAYIGFLVLVPIFAAKESRFAQYHANQGLILFIAELALAIVNVVISVIFGSVLVFLWFIGTILNICLGLIGVGILVLAIIGIINAVNGDMKELPFVGKIKILK